ncbi:site-specific integrase [Bacteroides sedimenti]|uniref:Tyr recombinase domain-containing protein n=1 Tax=Bacteroides sedimenti TaxID=2136147 RepID=A0ABN6Z7J5_9BACE
MKNSILRYVFDRKKQATDTETGLLQIEVREAGSNKKVLISTGIRLLKHQFSTKNGFTCVKHDKATMITLKARKIYDEIETFVSSSRCHNLSDARKWDVKDKRTYSVVAFILEELKKRDPKGSTVEHHMVLVRKLEAFEKIRTFDDVTYENIADFDLFLRKTISSQPVLYKRHSALRDYIKTAVKKGLCETNPYGSGEMQFDFGKGKSKEPVFLLEHEIKKIQEYKPLTESLERVKDLFLFQCFSGVAYSDLMSFDASKVYEMDGYKVYRSSRTKTDESFICVLLPEAQEILEKYKGVLPRISNQNYNSYIKIVAAGAGVNKTITTHTGRHTFATYLLNRDVPIETVSRAIGHSSIRQTLHYARMLGKKVINDIAAIIPQK